MSVKTVLADYEPWPIAVPEDHRRETMTVNEFAAAEFMDSLADADAAMTNPDVANARQNTFIN